MGSMPPDWRAIGSAAAPAAPAQMGQGRALPTMRHAAWIAGACLVALIVGASAALMVMPTTGGVVIDAHQADVALLGDAATVGDGRALADLGPVSEVAPRPLIVDVEGAVIRPGLVEVPAGGRVGDALRLAGGFAPDADLVAAAHALNLAQEATDGLKVVVPAMGDAPAVTGPATPADDHQGGDLVDLNHATETALDSLPGVGPATIAKIVAAREEAPFQDVEELRSRGIVGDAAFQKLRELVTVGR